MKLKLRGICMILSCITLFVILLLNQKLWPDDDISTERHDVFMQNGGHLNVIRKDLDESNYKSDSQKNDEQKNDDPNGDVLNDKQNVEGESGNFEEKVMKTIQETIRQSRVFQTKESLLKLVDAIQAQANNGKIEDMVNLQQLPNTNIQPELKATDTFTIGWFGKPGNRSEMINLSSEEVEYLQKTKPFKKKYKSTNPKYSGFYANRDIRNLTSSQAFHKNINQFSLYNNKDGIIDHLLRDLNTLPIVNVELHDGGTQIKLILHLSDGSRAMYKPMRFPRERETLNNHYYWSDYERHTAEIASFHLDRLLEFNSVPPVAGRVLNMTTEIERFAADDVKDTFFYSPVGNRCFYGKCDYYCDSSHAVCGYPDVLEGSVMAYLPTSTKLDRKTWRSPWKRTYSKHKRFADWEKNPRYCDKIKRKSIYSRGRRLLDLMDMAVFDFLIGNLDRHHYETFEDFGNNSIPLHLDQGRAFGRPRFDDLSILAPVTQCCTLRHSTLKKLVNYYKGPIKLSDAMKASLDKDPIAPILLEKHLVALDRRVKIILKTIYNCMKGSSQPYKVIVDDGF